MAQPAYIPGNPFNPSREDAPLTDAEDATLTAPLSALTTKGHEFSAPTAAGKHEATLNASASREFGQNRLCDGLLLL